MKKLSYAKTLLKLELMLEQSIQLQCRIISNEKRLEFEKIHREVLAEIQERVIKLVRDRQDNN